MKTIVEYINESISLNEAKKVKLDKVLDCLDKIDDWNKADNIKKLMAEYIRIHVCRRCRRPRSKTLDCMC